MGFVFVVDFSTVFFSNPVGLEIPPAPTRAAYSGAIGVKVVRASNFYSKLEAKKVPNPDPYGIVSGNRIP